MSRTRQLLAGGIAVVLLVAVALLATQIGSGGGTVPSVPADPHCAVAPSDCVTIGIGESVDIGTLLRTTASDGIDEANSVGIAVDYLSGGLDGTPGTIFGHPVQVVTAPDRCSAASGVAGARSLLQEAPVLGVIGPTCSATAFHAADRVLSAAHTLLISPQAASILLTSTRDHRPYFFRTAYNDLIQAAVVADFIDQRLPGRHVAVIATRDAYSMVTARQLATDLQTATGRTVTISLDGADPAASLTEITRSHPGVIVLPVNGNHCADLAHAVLGDPNLAGAKLILAQACQTTTVLGALGAQANGVLAAGPDAGLAMSNAFYTSEFLPAYRRLYGINPPTVYDTYAFDATNLLLDAIQRVAVVLPGGVLRIDRAQLRAAVLSDANYDGLSGSISCAPTGDCAPIGRIAIYRAPDWPVAVGTAALPVFSETKMLSALLGNN